MIDIVHGGHKAGILISLLLLSICKYVKIQSAFAVLPAKPLLAMGCADEMGFNLLVGRATALRFARDPLAVWWRGGEFSIAEVFS